MLRLAFFGSDHFSINCLKQILPLYNQSNTSFQLISHLDIITRSPKLSGRGMKQLKDVPIASFAESNSLNLLRADKKSDFANLSVYNYDICIAVSYGRLIPFTFLNSLKFGGLNVHPSILPKYSGPAPLQRALLNKDETTGVTIQTLHPTEFDKGDILLRQPYSIEKLETIESLTDKLSITGGKLLKKVLEDKIYDVNSQTHRILPPELPYSYANKIQSSERQILWDSHTMFDLIRRENTLGNLYTFKHFLSKKKKSSQVGNSFKRIILSHFTPTNPSLYSKEELDLPNGTFRLDEQNELVIKLIDGYLKVGQIKTEGFGTENGEKFFNSLKKKFGTVDNTFTSIPN